MNLNRDCWLVVSTRIDEDSQLRITHSIFEYHAKGSALAYMEHETANGWTSYIEHHMVMAFEPCKVNPVMCKVLSMENAY